MGAMARKPAPQALALADAEDQCPGETLQVVSPAESRSPRSPRSPFRFAQRKPQAAVGVNQPLHVADLVQQLPDDEDAQFPPIQLVASAAHQPYDDPPQQQQHQQQQHQQQQPQQQQLHQQQPPPPPPPPPQPAHTHRRQTDDKASKSGFFFFTKSSKSTERLASHHHSDARGDTMSRGADHPPVTKQISKQSDSSYADLAVQKPSPSLPSKSDLSLASSTDLEATPTTSRKPKPKPFALLGRTKSVRDRDASSPQQPVPAPILELPPPTHAGAPLRTAPIAQHDRSFRDMMSSAVRNHSADRAQPRDVPVHRDAHRDRDHPRTQPSSLRDNSGSTFFSGLKSSSSKAADMISKGLFGKGTRSGSTTERDPVVDDEHYVLKVINQPLVEQTRLTRISKRLEDSRDKTEFWMPAFPWRAIDYLNYKGTDVEGLYRVPGSGPQIKKWQRRFDEEYDVDLFAQDDLYDINIIGSMLKAWLRELPDELFPKEAQERVARECMGADTVPQLLIDELSNLSPFNYYLLFAITCHLSLLLAHSDKNKMDFRNLCICFQPCMKIDAFSFKFLVCDWRDCWKGCRNESRFIEEEYMLFDQPPPRGIAAPRSGAPPPRKPAEDVTEDRNVSSSDSSKQSNHSGEHSKSRLKQKNLAPENGSVASNSTMSTSLTVDSQRETTPRRSGDLRPPLPH